MDLVPLCFFFVARSFPRSNMLRFAVLGSVDTEEMDMIYNERGFEALVHCISHLFRSKHVAPLHGFA
jgi:hypothetical protein